MKKIGILGDIGSGKTFVAKKFDCPVFVADDEVSKISSKNKFFFNKLKKKLPKYIKSFPIKKKEIISAILENKNNLKKITNVIHPIVRKEMSKFLIKNKKKKIVVLDIPLLLENKLHDKKFILIYIDANKKNIMKRLHKRKNFDLKIFKSFKKLQLPIKIKKKKANYIIKNNFKNNFVLKRVNTIKKDLLK